jgi:hypothetical protein
MLAWNHLFYPYIPSWGVLRKFYMYEIGMIVKASRAAAFLSRYYQTSLLEVRFVSTLHAWSTLLSLF